MANSEYFRIVSETPDEAQARSALLRGTVQFVVTIPPDFTSKLLRGDRPTVLIEADASDPTATGAALAAITQLPIAVSSRDLKGPLAYLAGRPPPFDVTVHRLYNPESLTQYNIVPGLMGVILTMTMVMMTGLAITRERERGTMENLLAMPLTPLEVMTGKIIPYIAIGLVQASIILLAARFMFQVPFVGSLLTLFVSALLFIACNLTVGITVSSLAQNQLQAMQLTFFYFLPNILLSGFMFPFRGMPRMGAGDRQRAAAHALQSPRARHPAEGQRLARPVDLYLADDRVHGRRHGHRAQVLPEDTRLKRTLALLVAVACAGCTVGPDFRQPDPPPVQQFAPGSAPDIALEARPDRDIPAEWWTLFGAPELDALVRRALAGSPTLDQARARLEEARELSAARVGATEYPAVDLKAGIVRQRIDPATVGFPQAPNPGPFTVYTIGANVSYTFDIFGGTRRELEGLAAQIDYQAYELEAARLTLAANVVTTAIRLAGLRAEIESNEAILATQTSELAIAEQRLALGGVSELDVRNQQALLADTKATLPSLYAQRERAIHLLAIYVGEPPAAVPMPTLRLADLRLPVAIPLRLPADLVRQRPDIRASEALLHRASADIGVATANLYPKLQISGGLATSQLSAADLFGNGFNIWNIGGNLLQPLFRGGELQARKRAAIAVYAQADAAYRQAVLQGIQNVADVLRTLEADARAEAARVDQLARVDDAYRITVGRFDAGGVSRLAVLDAQRAKLRAETEHVQAIANRLSDAAALFQALGGGWWQDPANVANAR